MKALTQILVAATLVLSAALAQAEEIDDVSLMLTEGKIEASMLDSISQMRAEVYERLDQVGKSTEITGNSGGRLKALGIYEDELAQKEAAAKNAIANGNSAALDRIYGQATRIHKKAMKISAE